MEPTQADLAIEARRGGRVITERLATLVAEAGHYWPDMVAALRGEAINRETGQPITEGEWADQPRRVWNTHVASREQARQWAQPDRHQVGRRSGQGTSMTLAQAEAMTTWPIIVAAYRPTTTQEV